MAYLHRLIKLALVALLLSPLFASADFPAPTQYRIKIGATIIGGWESTLQGACGNAKAYKDAQQTSPGCKAGAEYCIYTALVQDGACYTRIEQNGHLDLWPHETSTACPIGSASTGAGSCSCLSPLVQIGNSCQLPACPVGQHEEGGACVPDACQPNETRVNGVCVPEPPCPAGQQRVNGVCKPYTCPSSGTASDQWYDLTSASTSSTCLFNSTNGTYCVLTIKPQVIARTNGSTSYMGGYGVYTGGTCGPSEPGKPTPQDPDKPNGDPNDGTKPPGPTDPKPSKPPAGGGQPGGPGGGNPNPDGTCPPGTYKSNGKCYPKDPPKEPPDNDGKCPQGYVKVGSECVPLQPPPDDEEGKDPSQFGGQCAATTCEGDAIQCAIVRDQYKRACELFEKESLESQLYGANKAKEGNQTTNLPGNESISLSGRIDTSNALGGVGGGVRDLNVTVAGQQITLPFSMLNEYLEHLGNLLVAVSFLLALRIVSRG